MCISGLCCRWPRETKDKRLHKNQGMHARYCNTSISWVWWHFALCLDTLSALAHRHSVLACAATIWWYSRPSISNQTCCDWWKWQVPWMDSVFNPSNICKFGCHSWRCFGWAFMGHRRGYGIELLMWLRSLTDWVGHIVYLCMIFAMDRLGPQCGWRTATPQRWVFQEGRELDQECRHCPAPGMVSRHLCDELFSILINLWYHYRYLWCLYIRSIRSTFDFRPIYKRNSWSKDRTIYLRFTLNILSLLW